MDLLRRGRAWSEKNELDRAIADFGQAIRIDAAHPSAYLGRGYAWHRKHETDKAIADYNEASRLNPTEYRTFVNRGMLLAGKKEYAKAIADYDAAIQLAPGEAHIYNYRGYAWSQLQDQGKAIADYTEAIRLDSNDTYAHISLAWILTTSSDRGVRDAKRAVPLAKKACELSGWKVPGYLETLAAACGETGDFASAVKWQIAANELRSDPKEKTAGEERLKYFQFAESRGEAFLDR